MPHVRRPADAGTPRPAADAEAAAARLQRGTTHSQRGEYDRAIVEYTAALEAEPTLAATGNPSENLWIPPLWRPS